MGNVNLQVSKAIYYDGRYYWQPDKYIHLHTCTEKWKKGKEIVGFKKIGSRATTSSIYWAKTTL